jgi:hypothetical protein
MTKDEALKMAIEALWLSREHIKLHQGTNNVVDATDKALNACKEALEQPAFDYNTAFSHGYEAHRVEQAAQEPVAFIYSDPNGNGYASLNPLHEYKFLPSCVDHKAIPLYTHPHHWQGLTDDEISQVYVRSGLYGQRQEWIKAYNEANAKLKEKNYGTDVG